MHGRRQISLLLVIMLAVAIGVAGIVIFSLYHAAFEQQRQRLAEIAKTRARMIEAVAGFEKEFTKLGFPGDPEAATLEQVRRAHDQFEGIGKTGEFRLGKREGDYIVLLLPPRFPSPQYSSSVPISLPVAEPMRRALTGESGTMLARGFRDQVILCAYEPVEELNWGIIAKIDVQEIRAPFIRAGLLAGGGGLALILVGTILFLRIGNPIIQRLEENERKYRSMFESAADRLFLLQPNGTVLDVNPSASLAYGFSREELVGRDVKEIVHPEHHDFVENSYKEVTAGQTIRRESIHLKKDGTTVPVEVQLSPILHGGRVVILAAARDISARKQAEQALRESETRYRILSESLEETVKRKVIELQQAERLAAIGRMVAIVAHEIRNPLQNIYMGVDALRTEMGEDKEKLEILDEIEHGVAMLNTTVKELLDYARPVRLHPSAAPVGEIVRRALKMLAPQLREIEVSLDLEQDSREVSADIPKIIRVLINLFTNAVEAMPGGGTLHIRSEFQDMDNQSLLNLTITDTGSGIEEKHLERIFEPFFTTKGRGTGLGLAISKKIIDAHDGRLSVKSKVAEGTTVEIVLPVRPQKNPGT